jgi:glutamine amidotransferase
MPQISVVDYGVGNLRSVKRGLEKSGANVLVTHNSDDLDKSDAIVFPGVGAFAPAIKNLDVLSDMVRQWAANGKPILGICLGLQLLFTKSSEGGSLKGLDLIPGEVVKLPSCVKTPQMGWNTIDIVQSHPLLDGVENGSYVYFVHSYISQPTEPNVIVACTEYGVRFPSIVAKRNLLATQFHPEKSSHTGSVILRNFIEFLKR